VGDHEGDEVGFGVGKRLGPVVGYGVGRSVGLEVGAGVGAPRHVNESAKVPSSEAVAPSTLSQYEPGS